MRSMGIMPPFGAHSADGRRRRANKDDTLCMQLENIHHIPVEQASLAHKSAKIAFSERNPYPGWIAWKNR